MSNSSTVGFWPMDVDHDGKTDLVQGINYNGSLVLVTYLSYGSGFSYTNYQYTGQGAAAEGFYPMDVDGDGKMDLVQEWKAQSTVYNQYLPQNLLIYRSTGTGFAGAVNWTDFPGSANASSMLWPMDVDGQLGTDFVRGFYTESNTGAQLEIELIISNGTSFNAPSSSLSGYNLGIRTSYGFYVADVDGDGKKDILQIWYRDFTFDASVWFKSTQKLTGVFSKFEYKLIDNASVSPLGWYPVDVNGDGKADIVQAWGDGQGLLHLTTYISKGRDGFSDPHDQNMQQGTSHINFYPMDVNGDGKADIVQAWDNGGSLGLLTYLSTGTGFAPGVTQFPGEGSGNTGIFPMDVNGDGKADLVQTWQYCAQPPFCPVLGYNLGLITYAGH